MPDSDRFTREAATWDEKPEHVDRVAYVVDAIRRSVPLRPDMSVIEIGGGTGLLARALAEDVGVVTVTDVAPGMVEAATAALDDTRYRGWQASRYDIEHDPLPGERYDLLISLLALHHMGDVAAVIHMARELLRPGGWVALIDLDHDPDGGFHSHVPEFDGHHGFERDTIRGWLETAGFEDVALSTAHQERKTVAGVEREFSLFLVTGRRPE